MDFSGFLLLNLEFSGKCFVDHCFVLLSFFTLHIPLLYLFLHYIYPFCIFIYITYTPSVSFFTLHIPLLYLFLHYIYPFGIFFYITYTPSVSSNFSSIVCYRSYNSLIRHWCKCEITCSILKYFSSGVYKWCTVP
jgi:hypothetical protein